LSLCFCLRSSFCTWAMSRRLRKQIVHQMKNRENYDDIKRMKLLCHAHLRR
jgi:hypothetical protein